MMLHWMAASVFSGGDGLVLLATMEEVHVSLLPSDNLKEAVASEQADGLGISVVSTSLTITDVECGDSILIRLSGVAVMAVVEYMAVGGSQRIPAQAVTYILRL